MQFLHDNSRFFSVCRTHPSRFFPRMGQIMSRKWVRVWVKETPESTADGTDSGSPNGGVKYTKPVILQTRYPSENGSGAFFAQDMSDFYGLRV